MRAARPYEELHFIRPGLAVNYLVADRVEDILPMLIEAAQSVTESEKDDEAAGGGAGVSAAQRAPCRERHRLDLVALGIADEGRVVAARCIPAAGPGAPSDAPPPASAAA